MKVLHAVWLPEPTDAFLRSGSLRLWAETLEETPVGPSKGIASHPFHLRAEAWPAFLEALGATSAVAPLPAGQVTCTLHLPSGAHTPLPSPPLAKYWPQAIEETPAALRPWQVDCQRLAHPIRALAELHFLAAYRAEDVEAGGDFLFWCWFTQGLKRLLVREQYLPALVYRQPPHTQGQTQGAAVRALRRLAMGRGALRATHRRGPRADAGGLRRGRRGPRRGGAAPAPLRRGAARSDRAPDPVAGGL
ncbi:MAG: hypothetical protein MUC77_13845 [Chromatiaceae bacterium]|nr:hypothetical protein [Chromatiaceae bacterium]